MIPSLLVSLLLAQSLTPVFVPFFADPLARHIARELKPDTLSNLTLLQAIRRYGLAWCYLSDKENLSASGFSSAFAPSRRQIPSTSRALTIRDDSFYEAVVPYSDKLNLHVGLPYGHTLPSLTSFDSITSCLYMPVYFGTVLIIMIGVWVASLILLETIIGSSIRSLGSAIDTLSALISEPYTKQQINDITRLTSAPSDFRALGKTLNILMNRVLDLKDSMEKSGMEPRKPQPKKPPPMPFQTTETTREYRTDFNTVESGVFAVKFDKELRAVESSYEFAVQLLDGIHELYTDIVDSAAFLKIEKNRAVTVETCLGLDDDSLELLNKIDHREFIDERNMSKKSIDVGPMLIKKLGFESLAQKDQIGRIIYLPFSYEGKPLALLAGFMRQGKVSTPERIRALERFRDKALELYHEHRIREERNEDRWNDPATGMGNKIYFQELMPKIVERVKSKGADSHFSILMIQPDFSTPRLARFPAEMQDRWFSEIGKLITGLLPISKRIIPEKGATNYLIRYHEHVMAVVLEGINGSAAINVAEGIRSSVISKAQWSGGATDLSVSVGVATFPRDSENAEELVGQASRTLSYVKEKLGGNSVCDFQKVPADYRPKEVTEIQGTLGVMDNVGLLQSIASTEKSGVLIVVNDSGQKFVTTWIDGSPTSATLDDLAGQGAMTEFITTFKTGSYNFQTRIISDAQQMAPTTLRSLERCLMEAALAEDKMMVALRMIPTPDRLVRKIDNPAGWKQVAEDSDVDPEEISAMEQMVAMANGTTTLLHIFGKLNSMPTSLKWRAAGLLLQYQLMQMRIN